MNDAVDAQYTRKDRTELLLPVLMVTARDRISKPNARPASVDDRHMIPLCPAANAL